MATPDTAEGPVLKASMIPAARCQSGLRAGNGCRMSGWILVFRDADLSGALFLNYDCRTDCCVLNIKKRFALKMYIIGPFQGWLVPDDELDAGSATHIHASPIAADAAERDVSWPIFSAIDRANSTVRS